MEPLAIRTPTLGCVRPVRSGGHRSCLLPAGPCRQPASDRGWGSTTNAVVISIVAIYILNFFLTYLMFGRSG